MFLSTNWFALRKVVKIDPESGSTSGQSLNSISPFTPALLFQIIYGAKELSQPSKFQEPAEPPWNIKVWSFKEILLIAPSYGKRLPLSSPAINIIKLAKPGWSIELAPLEDVDCILAVPE